MQWPWEDKLRKPGKHIKSCRAYSYRMEPAGIEPATSGLQSLAQGGPFTEKISIYAGFVLISKARDLADTDQIRI